MTKTTQSNIEYEIGNYAYNNFKVTERDAQGNVIKAANGEPKMRPVKSLHEFLKHFGKCFKPAF